MLTIILDNLRSNYNVGAILRTADAMGVARLIACGTTPYPDLGRNDTRPPHVITANTKAIAKTALGAETTVSIEYFATTLTCLEHLRAQGYTIAALEQSPRSVPLDAFQVPSSAPLALVVGPEVSGITSDVLEQCDAIIEIPMLGAKESLNVAVAAGIALYHLTGTV